MENNITPIFILGSARNGTTYLSNTLCQHKDIACSQHKLHWGLHESNMLRNQLYWGDLSDIDRYIYFLELYSSVDYFKLVNGDKEYFFDKTFIDFYDFFFSLMDRYAASIGSHYWLTKMDPLFYSNSEQLSLFLSALRNRYNSYKFISIRRDLVSSLRSYISMEGPLYRFRARATYKYFAAILYCARYVLCYRLVELMRKAPGFFCIDFTQLTSEKQETIVRLCRFLDIDYDSGMLLTPFKPNTSKNNTNYERFISDVELHVIARLFFLMFNKLPCMAGAMARMRSRYITKPPLSWRMIKAKYMKQEFLHELEKQGAYGLCSVVESEK